MKHLLPLLALVSGTLLAAPPADPSISTDCGSLCSADTPFNLVGSDFRTNKNYSIQAEGASLIELGHSVAANSDGSIFIPALTTLPAGTWTINVYSENHNATPGNKLLASMVVTFN
jgi:hypothetical protein